jgi:hypothetical protein
MLSQVRIVEDVNEPLVKGMVIPPKIQERYVLSPRAKKEIMETPYEMTEFGTIVYKRTYSQNINGKKEDWPDTICRVVEGVLSIRKNWYKNHAINWDEEYWENFSIDFGKKMIRMQFLPGGRGIYSCGTNFMYEKSGSALNNCAFVSTGTTNEDFLDSLTFTIDSLMCGCGVGSDDKWKGQVYMPGCHLCREKENSICSCGKMKYVIHDSREGWTQSIYYLMKSYLFPNEDYVYFDYSKIRAVGVPLKTFGGISSGCGPLVLLHKQIRIYLETFYECQVNGKCTGEIMTSMTKKLMELDDKLVVDPNFFYDMENIHNFCLSFKDSEFSTFYEKVNVSQVLRLLNIWDENYFSTLREKGEDMTFFKENLEKLLKLSKLSYGHTRLICDIFNSIGVCIISGNIRRSSEIFLGEFSNEFMNLKNWNVCPERARISYMSNNTVLLKKTEDFEHLTEIAQRIKDNGEPGILNMINANKGRINHKPFGREAEIDTCEGVNPCVTGDNLVHTDQGLVYVKDLIGKQFKTIIHGKEYSSTEKGFWSSGIKDVYKVELEDGHEFRSTDNHKFCIGIDNSKQLIWKELSEIYDKKMCILTDKLEMISIKKMQWDGQDEVYDCTIPELGYFNMNGILTHNCSEIMLNGTEFCNLSEVFPNNCETYEELKSAVKYATFYCSTIALLATHWCKSNAIIAKNRRIGVSISDNAVQYDNLGPTLMIKNERELYKIVRNENKRLADEAGIVESIRVTTVKPSGTISLIANASPGAHYPIGSKYYIRRVRFAANSEYCKYLNEAGYYHEDDVYSPNTVVYSFPMKQKSTCRSAENVTMYEQILLGETLQSNWADNSVSQTIYFPAHTEARDLERLIAYSIASMKCMSFLPHTTKGVYKQSPYEDITEEEYNLMIKDIKRINWNNTKLKNGEGVKYCDGDKCTL